MRLTAITLMLTGALVAFSGTVAQGDDPSCPGADAAVTSATVQQAQDATRCLINAQRTSQGLQALAVPPPLAAAASGHAQDMVAKGYFSHQSADGRDLTARLQGAGYFPADPAGWSAGEDIGCGSGSSGTPRSMVAGWMQSPPHRAEILTAGFRDIGVGIAPGTPPQCRGTTDGGTYVADFGAPPPPPPPAAPAPPAREVSVGPSARPARGSQATSSIEVTCHRQPKRRGRASRKHSRLVCRSARSARTSR